MENDVINLIVPEDLKSEYYGSLDNEEDNPEDGTFMAMQEANNEPKEITASPKTGEKNLFFSDGKTRIDYVLVWEEELPKESEKLRAENMDIAREKSQKSKLMKDMEKGTRWRNTFLKNLKKSGLLIEMHETQNEKRKIHYFMLNAPWKVLCYYAEDMRLCVPLQASVTCTSNWSQNLFSKLGICNIMLEDILCTHQECFTCPLRLSKLERYLNSNNHEDFFTNTQRHAIVYEILMRAKYGHRRKGQIGIDSLLNEKVFSAAFPLHDGPYKAFGKGMCPEELSLRQVLYAYWACWGKWYKYQPLDHIRDYFGEKIAFYFTWLGFYTGWLLPAAILGTVIFIVGITLMPTDIPAKEICEQGDNYNMCPLCTNCKSWKLSSICPIFKVSQIFDYGGTVFFSIFMSLWAVMFLEYWKRKGAIMACKWDCLNYEETEERPRPEFAAVAPMTIENPITGLEEPHFPEKDRVRRVIVSSMVILLLVVVVLIFLISIILYRTIVSFLMYNTGNIFVMATAPRIASITGSVVNLLFILLMARVYTSLAHLLTKWEMHRTQSKYEDAFISKLFVFQFINFYSSPIYIAFFKGRFVGYPGQYGSLFGIRNEACGTGGCLIELAQELLIIMVGKQIINNVQEYVIPKVIFWWQKWELKGKDKEKSIPVQHPWEKDYQLLPCEGLFDEYLEMVLQFGFITIFVAACPLAPLCALLNNWVEIRLDANKFVCEYRRPIVERAQGIGIWFRILEIITTIAVITNAFLIAFTSDFLPRQYYRYVHQSDLTGYTNFTLAFSPLNFNQQNNSMCRYRDFRDSNGHLSLTYWNLLAIRLVFVIVFEHVVFFVARMIDLLVPDMPESLEIKVKKNRYMARQALAESQVLLEQAESPNGLPSPRLSETRIATDQQDLPPIPEDKPFQL
ncbi:anoctamin-7-like isoform X1 [Carcharodon carcharias]|uniref:anoctamin-7-like isoform X1 n=2 Tax=Carcharodon carcharias TaxID=13397 RepID=UPI001B7EE5EB|nr:anoctamin-7-like isoform X1 [Carcharodon carcharias]XP_041032713.1 anoctamin-7-like isoform X1 [Carcharodon carcharias]XP_041032723.1 anoctamin-7-like isoform X1 [Carcharodon carcharias]XP_041032732.1 anoctamin-7-like isoform X1 [Carcharodon carcharias]XP_041032739.1 anoctamin-7-like isoform X1 [Carcharodon carcharias]XP_041032750.1 anoctamin-7-like isoform X1 [Carcharodon carcharias]